MTRPTLRLLLLCLLPAATLSPLRADESKAFNFRAEVASLHDDNVFRTPAGNGQEPQSDTITTTTVGVDFNQRYGRQEIAASVSLVNSHYGSHGFLDATALDYNAAWRWAAGPHLSGELQASRVEVPNSFAEFPEIRNTSERNLRVTEDQSFGLEYAFHPSWRLIGDISHETIKNEQVIFAFSDVETVGTGIGVKYAPASGNWLSWEAKQYEGHYTQRHFDPALRFDDDFTQPSQEFNLNWQLTGHSTVSGRLAYLHRKHAHFSERNYAGWAGQLSYLYQYSARTLFNLTYLHGLDTYQDQLSSYYVSDGVTLGAQWAATEKISLGAHAGYAHQRYRGAVAALLPGEAQREANAVNAGIDVGYKPLRWLELKAGLMAEKRNSNDTIFNFIDHKAMLSAAATF